MGLFQDNFSMLSELERLAAMVQDPVRIREIGADQWPLAMIASGLMTSNDPSRLNENREAYAVFVSRTTPEARLGSLRQLARFITQRKGEGWRALLPYALSEPQAALCREAGILAITLAKPTEQVRFTGVEELVRLLSSEEGVSAPLLNSLLGWGDMRFLPLLEPLYSVAEERLRPLLAALEISPNHLSCSWMLELLERRSELSDEIVSALSRVAPEGDMVLDILLPIPTWAYEKPTPQALHGWSGKEYMERMRSRLEKHLSPTQLAQISATFGA